jgi:enoyl-CoA hydratase
VGGDAPQQVAYETLDEGRIARIWLNRPEAQNAQSRTLLVQLDEAFSLLRPTMRSVW